MRCTPSPITVALTESPEATVGGAAVDLNRGECAVARHPRPESVAVTVTVTARFVHPLGTPPRWVTGSVLSTRRTVSPTSADLIPDPDTATTWTWFSPSGSSAIGSESSSIPPRRSVSVSVQRLGPAHGRPSGERSIETA